MADGNTYAINKHLNDQEDWDALQEAAEEIWEAEAETAMLIGRIEELEAKLAKVITIVEERHVIHMTGKGRNPADYVSMWSMVADEIRELAALKGQDNE